MKILYILSKSRFITWTTQHSTCERRGVLSFINAELPVHQHVFNSRGVLIWRLEGRAIDDFARIEYGDVGKHSLSNQAAAAQPDTCGGRSGHLLDRRFQR